MILLLLLALASAQTTDKQCEDLIFAIEAETTNVVMNQINTVASEISKLVDLTHDYIEPLKIVDLFPWEDKMRGTSFWTPDSDGVTMSGTYTEEAEAVKMRKILFENMKLQHPDRPLIWYALGLEPDNGSIGGYFGYSQFDNDALTPGQYIFDSTIYTADSDSGATSSGPYGLHWMRFRTNSDGEPLFTQAKEDWGYYTPTIRPWYIEAQDQGSTKFLAPYVMVSTDANNPQQQIGVGVVSPIFDDQGIFKGALDAEFLIDTFSDLLTNQREAADGGLLYIYDKITKDIIASSSSNLLDANNKLYKADDTNHPDQMVKDSYYRVLNAGSLPLRDTGTSYYIYADEYDSYNDLGMPGMDWIVVTVWPKFNCVSPFQAQATQCASDLSAKTDEANICAGNLQASRTMEQNARDDLVDCRADLKVCNEKECSKTSVIILGIVLILFALVFCIYVRRSKQMAVLDAGSTEMTKTGV